MDAFCTRCGVRLQEGASFCGNCGAPRSTEATPGPPADLLARPGAIVVLAVLCYVAGTLWLMASLFPFTHLGEEGGGAPVEGAITFAIAALHLAGGFGLWTLRRWGRYLAIALALPYLILVPFGTLVSVVAIVYLLRRATSIRFSGRPLDELSADEVAAVTSDRAASAAWVAGLLAPIGLAVLLMPIIAAIAIPNLLNAIDRGKQKRTMADLRTDAAAIEDYGTDHGGYPPPIGELVPLERLRDALEPGSLANVQLRDGWGHAVLYWTDGTRFVLVSPGKDGTLDRPIEPGSAPIGEGETTSFDADLVLENGEFVQWPEGMSR